MNKIALTLLITALMGAGLIAQAETNKTAAAKKQTTCPVMGGQIDKAQYADVQGKRIYVCCAGCIAKIKADPDKYIQQMEAEGITLDKTPAKEAHHHDHSGHKH